MQKHSGNQPINSDQIFYKISGYSSKTGQYFFRKYAQSTKIDNAFYIALGIFLGFTALRTFIKIIGG